MPERVHCHMIRKTRAMNLYNAGVPLPHIQQLLGHEDISTTSGFYAFITLSQLAKELENTALIRSSSKSGDGKQKVFPPISLTVKEREIIRPDDGKFFFDLVNALIECHYVTSIPL